MLGKEYMAPSVSWHTIPSQLLKASVIRRALRLFRGEERRKRGGEEGPKSQSVLRGLDRRHNHHFFFLYYYYYYYYYYYCCCSCSTPLPREQHHHYHYYPTTTYLRDSSRSSFSLLYWAYDSSPGLGSLHISPIMICPGTLGLRLMEANLYISSTTL